MKNKKGFSLIEVIFSLGVLGLIALAVGAFQRDVFFLNDVLQTGLDNATEARKVIRPFANEVRAAQPSDLGSFPIAEAATSSFSFYSDVDADGSRERVRYFLEDGEFKKGVINPTGNPPVYDSQNEDVIKIIKDVVASSTVFSYYDSTYNGTSSTTPLTQPVTTSDVRLIRVDLTIDTDPNRAPNLLTVTTQAMIRNLKDNLDAN